MINLKKLEIIFFKNFGQFWVGTVSEAKKISLEKDNAPRQPMYKLTAVYKRINSSRRMFQFLPNNIRLTDTELSMPYTKHMTVTEVSRAK